MKGDKTVAAHPSLDGRSNIVQRFQPSHGRTSGPTRRSTKGQWTPEEDEILCNAVERFNGKNWKKIAECFKDRTDVQCLHRWQKVLNPELVKGPWSKEEDETIVQMVSRYGPKKWSTIAQHLPGRIGKQCRERWHNHLNPSINKEAWTQEEELALIRAHQVYGNRWAELTKYLPGRTDNSIKNHWNSSVKKKLDSYIASGLLEQFQGHPLITHQSQSTPSSSLRIQSSGDDKIEEISECSQGSSAIPCSQSANDLAVVVLNETDEFQWNEEPLSCVRHENSTPASPSAQYYTHLEDVTYSMPEIPCQVGCSSRFVEHNLPHDAGTVDYQFNNVQDDISLFEELGQESSELQPVDVNVQTSSIDISPDKLNPILISDEECCRLLFSQTMNNGISDGNIQMSETDGISASCGQTFDDGTLIYCSEPNQAGNPSFGTQDPQFIITSAQDSFIYANDMENPPCDDVMENSTHQELAYLPKESSKLVPINSFNSRLDSAAQACSSVDHKLDEHTDNQDSGTLCYEPPRFPSIDIPFFSCDLVQPGSDSQQEYSPLGIRQLMMSSMNCLTPFRLWDSPTQNKSPDALLKSAAKTFTATPSILKKRNRDFLLSPLSDRRIDKKLETEMTSSLAKDFSRLDVMLDHSDIHKLSPASQKMNSGSSIEDKENFNGEQQKEERSPSEKNVNNGTSPDKTKDETMEYEATMNVNNDEASKSIHEPSGVLVEQNMNKLVSPDQVHLREDKTPRNHKYKSFGGLNHAAAGNDKESHLVVSVPSPARLENTAVRTSNDSTNANFGIFGGTPFKRSFDSPSAWKSPWFINTFVPGPRVDTDISIEDMGYFLSPGDRSYDALGLMKQLSEHTASAYADAAEVLGSETPDTILKEKRRMSSQNSDQENKNISECHASHSQSAPNVMTECRVLDFSDCGTPGKGVENGKSLAGVSLSSPSSYLLKSCR